MNQYVLELPKALMQAAQEMVQAQQTWCLLSLP